MKNQLMLSLEWYPSGQKQQEKSSNYTELYSVLIKRDTEKKTKHVNGIIS